MNSEQIFSGSLHGEQNVVPRVGPGVGLETHPQTDIDVGQILPVDHEDLLGFRAVENPDQTPAEAFRNLGVAVGAEAHPPPLVDLRHHPDLGGAADDSVGRNAVGVKEGREEGGVVEKAFDAVDGLGERGELGGDVV